MPIRKQVTLKSLAASLGVTVQTVSKALRGKPGMSPATRAAIVEAARTSGYLTRDQLRQFSVERIAVYPPAKRRFVLVQTEQSLNFNRLLLEGLNERFSEIGHTIETLLLPERMNEKKLDQWIRTKELHYCEGIFIAPRLTPPEWERTLLDLPIPRILLNYPSPGMPVDSVVWDVSTAVALAVKHLADIGHRRIMYAGDIRTQRGFALRWQSFAEAVRACGLPFEPQAHLTDSDGDAHARSERLASLLATCKPTAILCGIDEEVEPLYAAIRRLGLDVPTDLSLIGLLNEQKESLPLFTRPLLAIKETGYRAAERMLWRIANPTMPYEYIRIQAAVFAGSTTAAWEQNRD
ncbi:LacI family DNA-binding transcriptional regulator [Paenibacillus hodogayensis]|uniref:LacI family DNA-binding transcriptional regulator n=1 Tax=Paenibacillus hodogayensis TaxID=279208 RepID=A0ABV5VXA8_9BACL